METYKDESECCEMIFAMEAGGKRYNLYVWMLGIVDERLKIEKDMSECF